MRIYRWICSFFPRKDTSPSWAGLIKEQTLRLYMKLSHCTVVVCGRVLWNSRIPVGIVRKTSWAELSNDLMLKMAQPLWAFMGLLLTGACNPVRANHLSLPSHQPSIFMPRSAWQIPKIITTTWSPECYLRNDLKARWVDYCITGKSPDPEAQILQRLLWSAARRKAQGSVRIHAVGPRDSYNYCKSYCR